MLIVSFVDSVISCIVQPVLGHHQFKFFFVDIVISCVVQPVLGHYQFKFFFVDSVVSCMVQPVLGHHQGTYECTTKDLLLALHLYHVCYQQDTR